MRPRKKKPKVKAPGVGQSGTAPPKEHQLKAGYDVKRDGKTGYRDTTRAIIQNCINGLIHRKARDFTLLRIANDKTKPTYKRIAAQYVLHSRRATTLVDLEPFLRGKKTLSQLGEMGVDVSVIKTIEYEKPFVDAKGKVWHLVRRIELISAGENFDRLMNHTGISPTEQEKYKRLDAGLVTERFDVVEILVPGMNPPAKLAKLAKNPPNNAQ